MLSFREEKFDVLRGENLNHLFEKERARFVLPDDAKDKLER